MIKRILSKILRHEDNSNKVSSKKEFYNFVDSYASSYDYLNNQN